jgi:hypothetical protein
MARKSLLIHKLYEVKDKEKFFNYFRFKEDYNIGELWSDEKPPEKIVYRLNVVKDHKEPIVRDPVDSKVEFFERYKNKKSRPIYLSPKDIKGLSDKGAIKPDKSSGEILFKL